MEILLRLHSGLLLLGEDLVGLLQLDLLVLELFLDLVLLVIQLLLHHLLLDLELLLHFLFLARKLLFHFLLIVNLGPNPCLLALLCQLFSLELLLRLMLLVGLIFQFLF